MTQQKMALRRQGKPTKQLTLNMKKQNHWKRPSMEPTMRVKQSQKQMMKQNRELMTKQKQKLTKMTARKKMAKMTMKTRRTVKMNQMEMQKTKTNKRKKTAASQSIINQSIKNTAAPSMFDHTLKCLLHGLTRRSLTCYAQKSSWATLSNAVSGLPPEYMVWHSPSRALFTRPSTFKQKFSNSSTRSTMNS